jgi:callose synthase
MCLQYYFSNTILVGGAKYRPTGRGFVTTHESFSQIYRFHCASHFSSFLEIFMGLVLYDIFTPLVGSYGAETWSLWIMTVAWGFAPFWFNPMAFEYDKILADVVDWRNWMSRSEGDLSRSYQAWWLDEYGFYQQLTLTQRLTQCLFASRFLLIGVGLLYQRSTSVLEISLCLAFIATVLSVYALIRVDFCDQKNKFVQRSFKAVCVMVALALPIILLIVDANSLPSNAFGSALQVLLGLAYILGFLVDALLFFGLQWRLLLKVVKIYDWALGLLLLAPVFLLSLIYVPTVVQTRLLFNNAFSRGVIIEDLLRGKKTSDNAPGPSGSSSSQQTIERLDTLTHMLTEQSLVIARQREAIELLQVATGSLGR